MAYGAHKHLQIGSNLAHDSFGLLNLHLESTIVDHPRIAFALETGLFYTNPRFIWVLPKEYRSGLGVHVVGAPIRATATIPAASWIHLNMGFGYNHVGVMGEARGDEGFGEGSFGARAVVAEPMLSFFLGKRVAILAGCHWSLWSAV